MKYVIVIPDGGADFPLEVFDGRTAFEVADMPTLDRLAATGRVGTVATTPAGMPCGSDVCSMSLLGYDPRKYHAGRAPLEAAAMGLELSPQDWVFRLNVVTVAEGLMQDHSAGAIASAEAARLLDSFRERLAEPGLELVPGVSYRNLMIDRRGRDYSELVTTPPHDIPGEPIRKHLPVGGPGATLAARVIAESEVMLRDHEVNLMRQEMGEAAATHFWPWGQGQPRELPSFEQRFGLKGAIITAVDLLAGIARLIGWDRLDVPGQTSYHDNDYAATGQHAVAALQDYDVVCVHVEAPDEASHAADPHTKVAALEAIDQHVLSPIHQHLEAHYQGDGKNGHGYRLLFAPDHYTLVSTRRHEPTPVPFLMTGTKVRSAVPRPYTEDAAAGSDLHIDFGHELMEYFLFSALK